MSQAPSLPCTGVSRRRVIQAGLMGMAGLTMADVLRLRSASAAPGTTPRDTAVIYVVQEGGASQYETYDPKPLAPAEIRGEFAAIGTRVPGVEFSELMARQAKVMDKLVVLRSIHHPSTQHSSSVHLLKTGYYCRPEAIENEMPSVGSCVARTRGAAAPGLPPYVTVNGGDRYGQGHYLGNGFNPFVVEANPASEKFEVPNLTLVEGLSTSRLEDRRALLSGLDRAKRIRDTRGETVAMDRFTEQAFEMVTGPAARLAFKLDGESPKLRDQYGRNPIGQSLLLARRLVEHGVTFVTAGTFGWDHHGDLARQMGAESPAYDQAMAALVEDLHQRGLAKRVLVVAMGEFGRAPQYAPFQNFKPGRDHWGDVMSVLMAGGGLTGGQVIGASDAQGATAKSKRYRLECVLAHMYRHLGIDPGMMFVDHNGRPRNLLDIRDRIVELG